jgi:hypothetical protein
MKMHGHSSNTQVQRIPSKEEYICQLAPSAWAGNILKPTEKDLERYG